MNGSLIYIMRLTILLVMLFTSSIGQTVLVGLESPVPTQEQELPETPEMEPIEAPEAPEIPEIPEPAEPAEPLEPLEAPDVELPEEPCLCGIRCCTNPLELTRSPMLMNFHLPKLADISCCGCTPCPPGYFILPVPQSFVFSVLNSLSVMRMPG